LHTKTGMFKLITVVFLIAIAYCVADSGSGFAGVMVGGRSPLNLSDPIVYQRVENFTLLALKQIAEDRSQFGNSNNKAPLSYSLVKIVSAQSQVVSGMNYFIEIIMQDANCEAKCHPEACSLVIWSQPWLNSTQINYECKEEKKPNKRNHIL
jgi:hypothetical protein